MKKLDEIQLRLLQEVADLHSVPEGAYNIRSDGEIRATGTKDEIMPELMAASGVCSRLTDKV